MFNGALTAFVGDKQVPFDGLVNAADGTYVVENGIAMMASLLPTAVSGIM